MPAASPQRNGAPMIWACRSNYLFANFGCLVFASILGCSPPLSAQVLPFEGAPSLEMPGVAQAAELCAADLNQDGRADLVALSGITGRLTVLLNRGNGFVIEIAGLYQDVKRSTRAFASDDITR